MQLKPAPEIGVFRTALKLCERILPERIEAAKRAQAVGIPRNLLTRPVVLAAHLRILVSAPEARTSEHVGQRERHRAPNSRRIELRNEAISGYWFGRGRTEDERLRRNSPHGITALLQRQMKCEMSR